MRPPTVAEEITHSLGSPHRAVKADDTIAITSRHGCATTFVELIGIEPTTSGLQSQRSPN
jgi:hypothetical protein